MNSKGVPDTNIILFIANQAKMSSLIRQSSAILIDAYSEDLLLCEPQVAIPLEPAWSIHRT